METPRWHFRFDNYLSTLSLLQEAVDTLVATGLSDLEKAGTIQRFEICWELAWKSMRDYLSCSGATLDVPSPINVVRASFQINLITDGDAWVAAMKARNVMAHEYDCAAFEKTVFDIRDRYMPLLNALKARLEAEREAGN
jgi:nucleotidyltransferase substrate binding protein (TIGR01987 family)